MFRTLLLSACCWVGISSSAAAQSERTSEQEARHHFEAGRALVQVESFEAARVEFRRGFEISQRPLFLFNMAECARHLDLLDDARREYSEYLRREPESAFSSIAAERLAELGPGDTSAPSFIDASGATHEGAAGSGDSNIEHGTNTDGPTTNDLNGTRESTPKWYKHWAFWTVLGVVVVGSAIAIGVAASRDSVAACAPPMCFDWQ